MTLETPAPLNPVRSRVTALADAAAACGRSPFARVFGGLWTLLTLGVIGLYLANPQSPAATEISTRLKVGFVAGEIMLGSALVLVVALLVIAARPLAPRLRRAVLLAGFLPLCGLLALDWGQAFMTSFFAGSNSLQMAWANPLALLQHSLHFHRLLTLAMPVGIAIGAVLLTLLTDRWLTRPLRSAPVLVVMAAIGVAGSYWYSVPWSMLPFQVRTLRADAGGNVSTWGDYLNELYLRRTGPLTTLCGEVLVQSGRPLQADPAIRVVSRPQVPLEQYATPAAAAGLRRLNVIVLLVESLRTDELQATGGTQVVMPHLEALAKSASVFSNNYSTASHSNYADLAPLSSHYPLRSKAGHVYPPNPTYPRVLIYDVLKRFGYHTAIVSSQNENWGQMINYLSTDGLDDLLHSDNFDGETYVPKSDPGFAAMKKKSGKVDDRHTVSRALDWIDQHRDAPFFIYVNLQNSHFPFEVGPGFRRPFGPDTIDFEPKFNRLEPGQVGIMRARYRDSLAYADAQIGRLIEGLQQRGEWEDTLLVVSGDTGQAFMEHGFSGHASRLYGEVLRTPLIIRIPGRAPERSDALVQHVDVPPTVFNALNLPSHPSFQGRNLLAPPDRTPEVFLVAQTPLAEQYGIVRDGFKYLYEPFGDRAVLYDLRQDPGETRDVLAQQAEVADALRRRLDTWRLHQLEFYRRQDLHAAYYPPVLMD